MVGFVFLKIYKKSKNETNGDKQRIASNNHSFSFPQVSIKENNQTQKENKEDTSTPAQNIFDFSFFIKII